MRRSPAGAFRLFGQDVALPVRGRGRQVAGPRLRASDIWR